MNLTLSTRQAYSEIDEFIELLTEEQKNEIPNELRSYFKAEKDKNYIKRIDASIPIKEQNLKKETLALIALLNLQYWCKDEEEKKRLKSIYIKNENKYQEILRKKFNPNDVFRKKKKR